MEFTLLDKIGEGAVSEIFKAKGASQLQPVVALKRLKEEYSEDRHFQEMLEAEARLLARLGHPGLVQFYNFAPAGAQRGLIMEWVEGWNVKSILERHRERRQRVRTFLALWIAAALCHALHYLHLQGIVHADINPKNLMLTREGHFKLLDLGIAQGPEARFGEIERVGKGSISYMAPEQAQGTHLDEKSDLFSAGIVLYEMLCGKRPFQGKNRFEVEAELLGREIGPEQLPDRLDGRLKVILLKALQKDPARRFGSAAEFGKELSTFMNLRYPGLIPEDIADLLRDDTPRTQ